MVRIRLARAGAKKRPFYHIVVTDRQNPRDGRFIERIGYYDPAQPIEASKLDESRLQHWLQVGAEMSQRVAAVVRARRRAAVAQDG